MTFYYDTGMQLYFIQFKLGFHFNGKKSRTSTYNAGEQWCLITTLSVYLKDIVSIWLDIHVIYMKTKLFCGLW